MTEPQLVKVVEIHSCDAYVYSPDLALGAIGYFLDDLRVSCEEAGYVAGTFQVVEGSVVPKCKRYFYAVKVEPIDYRRN